MWILVAVAFTLAIVFGAVVYVTRRDFRIDLGAPTPEQARVRIEQAEVKPQQEAEAEAEEIRNATLEEKITRAKSIAARGKLRNN